MNSAAVFLKGNKAESHIGPWNHWLCIEYAALRAHPHRERAHATGRGRNHWHVLLAA